MRVGLNWMSMAPVILCPTILLRVESLGINLGNWVIGFNQFLGFGNSMLAEIWALYLGITLAISQGVDKIWIESDCLSLVSHLQNSAKNNLHSFAPLINACRSLLTRFSSYKITHVSREGNQVADRLADSARKSRCQFTIFLLLPCFCLNDVQCWPFWYLFSSWNWITTYLQGFIYGFMLCCNRLYLLNSVTFCFYLLNPYFYEKKNIGADQVYIGDGLGLSVQTSGSSTFTSFSGSLFLLNDILHVPSTSKNLISVSKFSKDNCNVLDF